MKKAIALIFVICFLAQFAFIPALGLGNRLNLISLFLIIVSLRKPFVESLSWACLAGILFDSYSFTPWGAGLISMILVAFTVDVVYKLAISDERNIFSLILIFSLGKIVFDVSYFLLSWLIVRYRHLTDINLYWGNNWSYVGFFVLFVMLGIVIQRLTLVYLYRIGRNSSKLILHT